MGALLVVLLALPLAARRRSRSDGRRGSAETVDARLRPRLARRSRSRSQRRSGTARPARRSGGWLHLDSLGAVFLLATGLLYAAGSAFSIGYLRGGTHRDRVRRLRAPLLRAPQPVRLDDAPRPADERLRDPLGRGRADHDRLRPARRRRSHGRRPRGRLEVRADRLGRARHRPARRDRPLRGRHRTRSATRYLPALRPLPRRRRAAAAAAGAVRVPARRRRVRHEGRLRAAPHLASGRTQRGADPDLGAPLRGAARQRLLRNPPLLPGRRRWRAATASRATCCSSSARPRWSSPRCSSSGRRATSGCSPTRRSSTWA